MVTVYTLAGKATRAHDGSLVAEASDLGLKPGEWPTALVADALLYRLASRDDGVAVYTTRSGRVLKVIND